MYYIVKGMFLSFFGKYPMVILWVCYGYAMGRARRALDGCLTQSQPRVNEPLTGQLRANYERLCYSADLHNIQQSGSLNRFAVENVLLLRFNEPLVRLRYMRYPHGFEAFNNRRAELCLAKKSE